MKKQTKNINYEQIDLLLDDSYEPSRLDSSFEAWDMTRGRNIIKAQGRDGKDITLYFDSLDQQYHLFEE
jgi:hypothetical protein